MHFWKMKEFEHEILGYYRVLKGKKYFSGIR